MPGFDMSDYVPVNERIAAFKADWPDGSLQSTIVELTESRVTVKAYAYRTADDARPGIGHSSVVIPGATPYTRGSEIENAETSAWGRAIAALGFEVKRGLASAEEVRNKQSEPGERAGQVGLAKPATTPAPADPETAAANRAAWAASYGWTEAAVHQAALDATNTPLGELDHDGWRMFAAAVVKAGPGLPLEKQATLPLDQGMDAGSDSIAEPEDTSAPEPEAVAPPSAPPVPPAEPPQPGTDEYKALPVQEKAKARAHWAVTA